MTTSHLPGTIHEAQDSYRTQLEENIISHLGLCALRGWTPADLRHEFSADIDPLLFLALPEIAYSCHEDMYALWINGTRPASATFLHIATLEKILQTLPLLNALPEWQKLPGLNHVELELPEEFTPEQSKAHHRITALLKKAESTNFEEEAEALILKAETLRQRYRIESLLIDPYNQDAPVRSAKILATRVYLKAPWIRHQFKLLSSVARIHSCEALLITKSGIATVFGEQDDVSHLVELFNSLNRQRDYFMKNSSGAREAQRNGETSSYRRSFMIAYANQITMLLTRAKEEAFDDLSTHAPLAHNAVVPVLEDRSAQSQEALKDSFPNTKSMIFKSTNPQGHFDGLDAANNSHLGGDSAGLENPYTWF
ncbi:DUF2786 domain-containing protein [Corynebacterium crudilactis]|uniref:DUF2786 domain-containing protein n=1 Tax=Corynebacterium crudilactis TaxID=1652495 RepID=A0A172QUX6_9CORY|nr:DUF2786 domain-containing protein [Corynebacterium crudilactis]ANE04466.1 hypothetical protein ccrud_09815 [Corynebacterium crudilactis]